MVGKTTQALFLTALLTVIGFSVHDTIVVFDRIRENSNTLRRLPYETIVNHSIVQTLGRSFNTTATVLLTLLTLLVIPALYVWLRDDEPKLGYRMAWARLRPSAATACP